MMILTESESVIGKSFSKKIFNAQSKKFELLSLTAKIVNTLFILRIVTRL